MKNKLIGVLSLVLLFFPGVARAQNRGTPTTLRVKTDANGYLVVAAAVQTNPVTQSTFINTRLATDSNGYLQVILSGGVTPTYPLAAPTSTDCSAPPYSFTGRTTTGLASLAANTVNLCAGAVNVLQLPSTGISASAASGVLTLAGLSGQAENLLFDFASSSNGVIIDSGTGVTSLYSNIAEFYIAGNTGVRINNNTIGRNSTTNSYFAVQNDSSAGDAAVTLYGSTHATRASDIDIIAAQQIILSSVGENLILDGTTSNTIGISSGTGVNLLTWPADILLLHPVGTASDEVFRVQSDYGSTYTRLDKQATGDNGDLEFYTNNVLKGAIGLHGSDLITLSSASENIIFNGTASNVMGISSGTGVSLLTWTGSFQLGGYLEVPAANSMYWVGRDILSSSADKLLQINGSGGSGLELNSGVPTLGTCTGGTMVSGSHNTAGEVTGNTSGSCVINFGTPNFTNTPFCMINDETQLIAARVSARSASSITVTGVGSGDAFQFVCIGRIGT